MRRRPAVVLDHHLRNGDGGMTLITFQDGKPVMRDGKVGTEQDCCCEQAECCAGLVNCTIEYRVGFGDGTSEDRTYTFGGGDPDDVSIAMVGCNVLRIAWNTEVNCIPDPETGFSDVYEWFTLADYDWSCSECCQQEIGNTTVTGGKDCTATLIGTSSGTRNIPEGCQTIEDYEPYIETVEVLSVSCDPDASPCNEFP